MERLDLKAAIEAVLYAAYHPLTLGDLAYALNTDDHEIEELLHELERDFTANDRGVCLRRSAQDVWIEVKSQFAVAVMHASPWCAPKPLSHQAIETIAIIALNEPVTVREISAVRGLDSAATLLTLRDLKLVERAAVFGRGREKYWQTTPLFLQTFGLTNLDELYDVAIRSSAFSPSLNHCDWLSEALEGAQADYGSNERADDGDQNTSAVDAEGAQHSPYQTGECNGGNKIDGDSQIQAEDDTVLNRARDSKCQPFDNLGGAIPSPPQPEPESRDSAISIAANSEPAGRDTALNPTGYLGEEEDSEQRIQPDSEKPAEIPLDLTLQPVDESARMTRGSMGEPETSTPNPTKGRTNKEDVDEVYRLYFAPRRELEQRTSGLVMSPPAASTLRAQESDWRHFTAWCADNNLGSLPAYPQTVAKYISSLALPRPDGRQTALATIERRLSTISVIHKRAGFGSPATASQRDVAGALHEVEQILGSKQRSKEPLKWDRIVTLVAGLGDSIKGKRDKALLLVGFEGALLTSELTAIRVEHIEWSQKGVTIRIPPLEANFVGKGRDVWIGRGVDRRTCPIVALEDWLGAAEIKVGPIFRNISQIGCVGNSLCPRSITRIVKNLIRKAGLGNPEDYGGSSLRAGFVAESRSNGADPARVLAQTGNRTLRWPDKQTNRNTDLGIRVINIGL